MKRLGRVHPETSRNWQVGLTSALPKGDPGLQPARASTTEAPSSSSAAAVTARKRHGQESGFAMLLVFLMAACIAITLYMEVPRIAFEAERQHELLLVDRGNQFKRAIQVFVTDKVNNPTHRYPASLDELESFNNHRYLRHRYVDPMTGKDEWRLVHINGGILTDSVTTQAKTNTNAQSGSNTPAGSDFISQQAYMDSPTGTAGGGLARAMRGRPSDTPQPGGPGDSNSLPPAGSPGTQSNANSAGVSPQPPSLPGLPPGNSPVNSGQSGSSSFSAQQQNQTCADSFIGGCTPTTSSGQQSGQPGTQQSGNMSPGFGNPLGGGAGNAQSNAQSAAAGMINNLLTTPRPGGMPTNMGGTTVGGGIAGVASKYEAEGIMVINQRTKINEWEYIFDQTKYRAPPNPVSGPVGTPQQQQQAGPGGTPIGSTPPANPSGGGGQGQ